MLTDLAKACPACLAKRQHTAADWKDFHPHAGHGFIIESGWTTPKIIPPFDPKEPKAPKSIP